MRRSGKPRRVRVVVDTNLFISGVINKRGNPHELLLVWRRGAFVLVTSREQQAEIADVLNRPAIVSKYGVSKAERAALLRRIDRKAVRVVPRRRLPVQVRDPKDEKILAIALAGRTEFLLTGDEDLLVLNEQPNLRGLQIITVRTFLDLLREERELGS